MATFGKSDTLALAVLLIRSRKLTIQVISERLGLTPTNPQVSGTPSVPYLTGGSEGEHVFILEGGRKLEKVLPGELSRMVDTVLEELLLKIEPVADRLLELRSQVSATAICGYGTHQKSDWFRLSDSILQRFAALRLPIIFNLLPLTGTEGTSKKKKGKI